MSISSDEGISETRKRTFPIKYNIISSVNEDIKPMDSEWAYI